MKITYDKLWKMMIDKKLKKKDLQAAVGLSPNTLSKMGRDEFVRLETIARIADYLDCDIGDVVGLGKGENNEIA